MQKNNKKLLILWTLSALMISSCLSNSPISPSNTPNDSKEIAKFLAESKFSIIGKVEFPALSVKATIADIAVGATVSLIYPPDYSDVSLRNVTIETGKTDSTGKFKINPDSSFVPQTNCVYILEATKRIGGVSNNLTSLRTNIMWNGTGWDSITYPEILMNAKTTSLSIISSLNSVSLPSSMTIKKMQVINGISQVTDINSGFTADLINAIKGTVEQALTNNIDSVATISLNNSQYIFQGNPIPIPTQTQPPTITYISAATNTATTSSFTITGTNFVSGMTANIGTTAGTVIFNSVTSATVVFNRPPAGFADLTGLLSVTANSQIANSSASVTVPAQVLVQLPPTIVSVLAVSTSSDTQSSFEVTGTNFASGMTAKIGTTDAVSVIVNSDTSATVVFNRSTVILTGLLSVTLNGLTAQSSTNVTVPCAGVCGGVGG